MIAKQALVAWLATMPRNSVVYIDDGGLALCASVPGWDERPYLEVGGDPEEDSSSHGNLEDLKA